MASPNRRKNFESEMDAELRAHIEAYTADLVRSGLSPAEAERSARVEFGLRRRGWCGGIFNRHYGYFCSGADTSMHETEPRCQFR